MKLPLQFIYSLYRSLLHHPKYRWGLILGTVIYLLSPLDFSPDFFPLLGQIDDIALMMLLFTGLSEMLTEWLQNRQQINEPSRGDVSSENSKTEPKTVDVKAVSID